MAAKNKRKKAKRNIKQILAALLAACIFLLSAVITTGEKKHSSLLPTWQELFESVGLREKKIENAQGLIVTFLDVGQGDSILLSCGDFHALIDGGEAENAQNTIAYLKRQQITQLDYIFATHPHSDHIGALAAILRAVPTLNVVMPKLSKSMTPSTNTYFHFLTAVSESGAKASYSRVGEKFSVGEGTLCVLGPVQDAKELNNNSLVMRLDYGNRSFLFTGDMEHGEEQDLLDSTSKLQADVLKTGHHGSKTASGNNFLDAVSPSYAVISCGMDNTYGHPEGEVLQRLFNHRVTVYRTDLAGTITCQTDGNELNFFFEKEAV